MTHWNRKNNEIGTEQIVLKTKGNSIEISPFYISDKNTSNEYTVFYAIRDNKGKGIKADDLLKILKEING